MNEKNKDALKTTFNAHKIELIFCILFTLLVNIYDKVTEPKHSQIIPYILTFLVLYGYIYLSTHLLKRVQPTFIQYINIGISLGVALLIIPHIYLGTYSCFAIATIVLAILLFKGYGARKDENLFALSLLNHIFTLILASFMIGFFLFLLFGLLTAILSCTYALFEDMPAKKNYTALISIALFILGPYMYFILRKYTKFLQNIYENITKPIIQLIFFLSLPINLFITCILYGCFFIMISTSYIAKHNIVYVCFSYFGLAMVMKVLQDIFKHEKLQGYFNILGYLSIPVLYILWRFIFYIVGTFGFTEPRVYVFLIAIICTLWCFMMIRKRFYSLFYFLIASIAILDVISLNPVYNAETIERISQERRERLEIEKRNDPNYKPDIRPNAPITEIRFNSSRVTLPKNTSYVYQQVANNSNVGFFINDASTLKIYNNEHKLIFVKNKTDIIKELIDKEKITPKNIFCRKNSSESPLGCYDTPDFTIIFKYWIIKEKNNTFLYKDCEYQIESILYKKELKDIPVLLGT